MPHLEVPTGDLPLPQRWQGTPSRVVPARSLRAGQRVFMRLPHGLGYACVRSTRPAAGTGIVIDTEYGNGWADERSTVRVQDMRDPLPVHHHDNEGNTL